MEARIDSELLRTFVAIADTGSFTRAGHAVSRTQSAISMQIKKLEDIVGDSLFTRRARGVVLTQPGESLLTKARQIVQLLDQAEDAFSSVPLEGPVRVGVPQEYGATVLPDLLARFAERHPAVQVTVRCESSEALALSMNEGELDLAVAVIDSGIAEGETMLHDPTVWVTSSRHSVHEQNPLPVAMFEQGCWWRDRALKALDDRGRSYRVAYTSASVAGIQAAVTSGLAVAVIGQSMMPPHARLLTAEEGFSSLPGSSVVLQRARRVSSPAVSGMANSIRDAFRAHDAVN